MKAFTRVSGWICLAVAALMFLIGETAAGIILACLGGINLLLVSKITFKEKEAKAARAVAEMTAAAAAAHKAAEQAHAAAQKERMAEEAEIVREEMQRRKAQAESKPGLLDSLGRQYETSGDIDKAISYYTQAIVEGSTDPHPYERLATIYRIRGEYAEELRVCGAAVEMLERSCSDDVGALADFNARISYACAQNEGRV